MPVEFLGIAGTNPASEVTPRTGGSLDLEYTVKLARAHEDNGWDRILFAYHSGSPDPAQLAAYVAGHTGRLNLVVAHRPNVAYPTLTAKTFATLDHLSGGRFEVHVITGGSTADQAAEGDFLPKDDRYCRTREFIQILKQAWTSDERFDFDGEYYRFEQFVADIKPLQQPRPRISFGGSSAATTAAGKGQLGGEVPSGVVGGNDPAEAVPDAEHPDLARLGILDLVDRAGREVGDPLFSANGFHPLEKYAGLIRHYRERWEAYGHDPADAVVGAGFNGLYVKKTSQQAIEGYSPIFDAFMDSPGAKHNQLPFKTLEEFLEGGSVLVGSPEQVIDKFGRYQAAFGHELSGVSLEVPGLPEDENRASVETFVTEVIPVLRRTYPSRVWAPERSSSTS